jgi:hypothetical protein
MVLTTEEASELQKAMKEMLERREAERKAAH